MLVSQAAANERGELAHLCDAAGLNWLSVTAAGPRLSVIEARPC